MVASQREFGNSGARIPVVGQGTWQMEDDDRQAAIEALRAGIDLGMTHIDTAELYGSGRVEELVAEAIAGRRDELYLVSKVMPSHASRAGTIRACEQSLRRLRTDRLDCYLLHWPGNHPLEDTIGAFEQLREDGKIRAWGVSTLFAIPKASSAAHVRDNAGAAMLALDPTDLAALDAAFPRPRRRPGVPTL